MPGMMEKGAEFLGGKSRAAPNGTKSSSPANGHYSEPESGGGDSGDEHDVGMRVGAEYQARIPDFDPGATKYTDKDNGGMLVWSPYHSIPDAKFPGEKVLLWKSAQMSYHGGNAEGTNSRGRCYADIDTCCPLTGKVALILCHHLRR